MRTLAILFLIALIASCQDSNTAAVVRENPRGIEHFELISMERVTEAHIRGLHLLSEQVGWASGSEGTVLRMTDGETWSELALAAYAHLDFRDIHGFDAQTAVVMTAGNEGHIIRTEDGGQTWTGVYTNREEGIFLDGIDFDGDVGYCIGDPMLGRPLVLLSEDKGVSWQEVNPETLGKANKGEGSYAASGTTVVTMDGRTYAAYGGIEAVRVLCNEGLLKAWESVDVPLRKGEGCGIFSMAFKDKQHGVAVGGCYLDSLSTAENCAITADAGLSWQAVTDSPPLGYRSCVAYATSMDFYLSCGRTGIDLSFDDGQSWSALSSDGYYTCSLADDTGWLMGRNGKIAKVTW